MQYEKRYLGDGVYAECDGYHVILTVPGSAHDTGRDQRIALEPNVIVSLNRYYNDLRRAEKRGAQ